MDDSLDRGKDIFHFATLALKANKHALACKALEKYLVLRPSDPKGHFNLGTCLGALGERASALACFRRAFDLQPAMAEAAANAAGLLIQDGNAQEASLLCYQALQGDPDCAPVLHNLNTALRMVGRQKEAVDLSWRKILGKMSASPVLDSSCFTDATAAAAAAAEAITASTSVKPFRSSATDRIASVSQSMPPQGSRLDPSASAPDGQGSWRRPCKGDDASGRSARDSAARAVDGEGGVGSLTVACVRWGLKYGMEYVERLAFGVRRNLRNRRYRFVCFTDNVEALKGLVGVEARRLGERCKEWRGWWHKAFLFSSEADLDGRVLYIDLDTVITGSLEDIAGYSGPFATLSAQGMANERRPSGLNSSIMSWEAGSKTAPGVAYDLLREAYGVVTGCVFKLDHWLEMTAPRAGNLQQAFPGQIVEYKASCCRVDTVAEEEEEPRAAHRGLSGREGGRSRGRLPPNARVVCFPLEPKPHEVEDDWVQLLWRRERTDLDQEVRR